MLRPSAIICAMAGTPFGGGRDLDVQIRLVDAGVELAGGGDRSVGVAGEAGGDLDRDEAVETVAGLVDGTQQVERGLDVGDHQLPVRLGDPDVVADEVAELVVVVVAVGDGLLEDRRVRGEAPDALVDPGRQLTVGQPSATEVVEPRALTLVVEEIVQLGHVRFLRGSGGAVATRRARRSMPSSSSTTLAGRRGAEAVDGDHFVGPPMPAERGAGLDAHGGDADREHGRLLGARPRLEELPARHRHHPGRDAVGGEARRRLRRTAGPRCRSPPGPPAGSSASTRT